MRPTENNVERMHIIKGQRIIRFWRSIQICDNIGNMCEEWVGDIVLLEIKTEIVIG